MPRLKSRRVPKVFGTICVVTTLTVSCAITANRTDVAQAQASERAVAIVDGGSVRHVPTAQTTVGAILKEAGVEIGPADQVCPKTNVRVYNGMSIKIVRVVDEVITVDEPIAFATRRVPTRKLRVGLDKVTSEGQPGLKRLYYRVHSVDGVEKKRELVRAETVAKPKPKVIVFGDYGRLPSRGGFISRQVLNMRATAYDPSPRCCGRGATGRTCTGMRAGYGVVAVDPKVIRLGSRLYVEGYGYAIAGDRGPAIKGHKIDLGFDTYHEARKYGRKHITVHILQ